MNQIGNTQINATTQGSNLTNFQGVAMSLMKNASSFMQLLESSLQKSVDAKSPVKSTDFDFSTRWKTSDDSLTCMEHRQNEEVTEDKTSVEPKNSPEPSENASRQNNQNNSDGGTRNNHMPVTANDVDLQPIPLATSLNLINTLAGLNAGKFQVAKVGSNSVDTSAASVKKQVFSKVFGSNLLLSGKGSFKLSLTPPQLGRVEALFQKDGTKLSITLKVESAAAAQALKEGSAELGDIILNKSQEWEDVEINIEIDEEEEFQENAQSDYQDNQTEQDDEDKQGVE